MASVPFRVTGKRIYDAKNTVLGEVEARGRYGNKDYIQKRAIARIQNNGKQVFLFEGKSNNDLGAPTAGARDCILPFRRLRYTSFLQTEGARDQRDLTTRIHD